MTILTLAPVLAVFLAGVAARQAKVVSPKDGRRLLSIAFYITMPALFLLATWKLTITQDLLLFALLPLVLMVASYVAAQLLSRLLKLKRTEKGVFLAAAMIANSSFVLPFVSQALGAQAIAKLSIFDAVNAILTFSVVYLLVAHHKSAPAPKVMLFKKLLSSPPLWAIAIGLLLNIFNVHMPLVAADTLSYIGSITGVIIMLALGIIFRPRLANWRMDAAAITLRSGLGLIIAIGLIMLFDLQGDNRTLALVLASAPVGMNTITFASLENLGVEQAANIVSGSLLISLLLTPAIFLIV